MPAFEVGDSVTSVLPIAQGMADVEVGASGTVVAVYPNGTVGIDFEGVDVPEFDEGVLQQDEVVCMTTWLKNETKEQEKEQMSEFEASRKMAEDVDETDGGLSEQLTDEAEDETFGPDSSNPDYHFPYASKHAAAHMVDEQDGKFYVVEDGGEQAAGPFDSNDEAQARADELNNLENLEAMAMDEEMDEHYAVCPICGEPIDYCQGHGELNSVDPEDLEDKTAAGSDEDDSEEHEEHESDEEEEAEHEDGDSDEEADHKEAWSLDYVTCQDCGAKGIAAGPEGTYACHECGSTNLKNDKESSVDVARVIDICYAGDLGREEVKTALADIGLTEDEAEEALDSHSGLESYSDAARPKIGDIVEYDVQDPFESFHRTYRQEVAAIDADGVHVIEPDGTIAAIDPFSVRVLGRKVESQMVNMFAQFGMPQFWPGSQIECYRGEGHVLDVQASKYGWNYKIEVEGEKEVLAEDLLTEALNIGEITPGDIVSIQGYVTEADGTTSYESGVTGQVMEIDEESGSAILETEHGIMTALVDDLHLDNGPTTASADEDKEDADVDDSDEDEYYEEDEMKKEKKESADDEDKEDVDIELEDDEEGDDDENVDIEVEDETDEKDDEDGDDKDSEES